MPFRQLIQHLKSNKLHTRYPTVNVRHHVMQSIRHICRKSCIPWPNIQIQYHIGNLCNTSCRINCIPDTLPLDERQQGMQIIRHMCQIAYPNAYQTCWSYSKTINMQIVWHTLQTICMHNEKAHDIGSLLITSNDFLEYLFRIRIIAKHRKISNRQ